MKSNLFSYFIALSILFTLVACNSEKRGKPQEKIEFPTASFTILPDKDTTLFGPQGTRLFIGAGSFQRKDGTPVSGPVQFDLKEFYTKADILMANLSTSSNGQLIETGGMLHLVARSNGQELELRPDKSIVAHFPKKLDEYKEMNLFYADGNATDSLVSNWQVDTVKLVKKTLKLGGYGWWYPDYDDSTSYDFTPKDFVDTGYYWNPLDFYVRAFDFSEATIKAIEKSRNYNNYPEFENWNTAGVECELSVTTTGYIKDIKIVTKLPSYARKEILKFLKGLPQLEPGKNKHGEIIERRGLLLIEPGETIPLYQTDEGYVKSFDKKYRKYENSPIKSIDDAELNFYVFSVSKLGWINCDRFLEYLEKINLLAQTPVAEDVQLKLAFKEVDGVLLPTIIDGKYVFENVPPGMAATLIGIKNSEDKGLQSAFLPINISNEPIAALEFKETTLAMLRASLEDL